MEDPGAWQGPGFRTTPPTLLVLAQLPDQKLIRTSEAADAKPSSEPRYLIFSPSPGSYTPPFQEMAVTDHDSFTFYMEILSAK